MLPSLLLFDNVQAEQRERLRQSEQMRLIRRATACRPGPQDRLLSVLSGLVIAARRRIQAPAHAAASVSQACCAPYSCQGI
jgi:hypothetical protein